MDAEGAIGRLIVNADCLARDGIPGALARKAREKFGVRLNELGNSELYRIEVILCGWCQAPKDNKYGMCGACARFPRL